MPQEGHDAGSHDRQLLGDIIAYAAARILPALVGLILLLIATRILSREAVGEYGLIVNLVMLFAATAGGWTEQTALRYYPLFLRRGEADTFFSVHATTVHVSLVGVFAVAILIYIAGPDLLGSFSGHYVLAVALLLAFLLYYNCQYVLMATMRSWTYSVVETTRALLTLGVTIALLIFWRADVTALLVGLLIAVLIPLPFAVRGASMLRRPRLHPEWRAYAGTAMTYGFPMAAWSLGVVFFAASSRVLVQVFQGSAEVGLFHANYQALPEIFALALTPLLLAAHPILIRAGEEIGTAGAEQVMTRFTRYFMLLAVPIAASIAFVSRDLTAILLGAEFQEGHVIVPWIVAGYVGWELGLFGNARFELEKRTATVLALLAVCVVANIALGAALIPIYGYTGAAIATCITFWIYPVLIAIHPGSKIRWRIPWRTFANSGMSVIVALVLAFLVSPFIAPLGRIASIIAGGVIICAAFLAVLVVLRETDAREVRSFISALRPAKTQASTAREIKNEGS